ncbi:hypothetical protein EJB05_48883, partial [Eragrostis curvula]
MGSPATPAPSTSRGLRRRSARLIGAQRRSDQAQPPRPPSSSSAPASPPPESKESTPPAVGVALRRSGRNHRLRIIGLPSATTPPSAPRQRRKASEAAPRKKIDAWADEWAKAKAASGASKEECDLPFLRKGAPRKDAGPAKSIEEAFRRLPLPFTDQEFSIDPNNKKDLENETEPPPYVHLKRNAYIVKGKGCSDEIEDGCVNCDHDSTCESCSCRSSLISCSQACQCSVKCSNKPFRREKKIKIVKTLYCGWGVITLESIEKDDFVIEFVGEVIDDVTCEERLVDMKQRRDQKFYMCKVSKDFVIDATFRGNACRFLNHSCQPNCRLEKWQVNGKTRLGVFASEAIEAGMPLTYDYRFSSSYGPKIDCLCGAKNCRGKL